MNKFDSTKKDAIQAKMIRRQYIEKESSKIDSLQQLHDKVRVPGMIISFIVGIFGVLILGSGLLNIGVWNNIETGVFLGVVGVVLLFVSHPLYKEIIKKRKQKYAQQIIMISNEITKDEEKRNYVSD